MSGSSSVGSDSESRPARYTRGLRIVATMLLGVGALLVGTALAYVGVSVYNADDTEAADAGIALLLVSAVIIGGVVFGGLRYLRRGRCGA